MLGRGTSQWVDFDPASPTTHEDTVKERRGDTDGGNGKPSGKQKQVGESYDAVFRGYINLNLNETEKALYEAWVVSDAYWATLEREVADGVNISLKIEPKQGGFLASATQRRVGSPNAGLVVTARGRNATIALGRVVYCLAVLERSPAWEDTQPMADPDRW